MGQFASLEDVKAHLNKVSSVDDGELTLMLDAAEEWVAERVPSFTSVAVTERVTATSGTVVLSRRPTGPVMLAGSSGSVTGFRTSSSAGVLYDVPYGYAPLTATYTAGDTAVPASVTLATAILAAHYWETQRGTSPSQLTALQNPDADPTFVGAPSYGIPDRVKELLEPFLKNKNTQIA